MLTQQDRKFTAIFCLVMGLPFMVWAIYVQYAAGVVGAIMILMCSAVATSSYRAGRKRWWEE